MRRYEDGKKLVEVVCNGCGRKLKVEDGYLKEFVFGADAVFGYFSRKDGSKHHFDLCEDCYDQMTRQFKLPPEESEETDFFEL